MLARTDGDEIIPLTAAEVLTRLGLTPDPSDQRVLNFSAFAAHVDKVKEPRPMGDLLAFAMQGLATLSDFTVELGKHQGNPFVRILDSEPSKRVNNDQSLRLRETR